MIRRPPRSPLFPYTPLSRSVEPQDGDRQLLVPLVRGGEPVSPSSPAEALTAAAAHHRRVGAGVGRAHALNPVPPKYPTPDFSLKKKDKKSKCNQLEYIQALR